MNILVVNTCNKVLQVALKKEDKEFLYNYQSSKHNECLLDLIEKILTDSNLTLNNIDCIGVVVGPGSFTGIRVGIATVKAFKMALNIPTYSINNLELLYESAIEANIQFDACVIPGSSNTAFVARNNSNVMKIEDYNVSIEDLKGLALITLKGEKKFSDEFDCTEIEITASAIFKVMSRAIINKSQDLTPIYFQLSQAQLDKINKFDFEIIEAQDTHLNKIFEIQEKCFSNPLEKYSFDKLKEDFNSSIHKFYVAKFLNEVVGYVSFVLLPDEISIEQIAVDINYRRHKIATNLLKKVEEFALQKNLSSLSLELRVDNDAIKLYEKFGFKITRKREGYYKGVDGIEMIKHIHQ